MLIAHPHPLQGGTFDNKVVHTLARAALSAGFAAVRFNFRGVERATDPMTRALEKLMI